MEHRFVPDEYFLVSIAFDTLQSDGVTFRLRARSGGVGIGEQSGEGRENWPEGTFRFPARNARYVIAAGFKSTWRTAPLVSAQQLGLPASCDKVATIWPSVEPPPNHNVPPIPSP
jgi:hypothetical protein